MTASPLEARCSVCLDTGSLSQHMDGFLDCRHCDAVERRLAMRAHLAQFTAWPSIDTAAWAAYLFAQRQAAPVAAQPPHVWAEAWHDLRDDVLSGVDGLDNDQVNTVLGMLDNYEPAAAPQPAAQLRAAVLASSPNKELVEALQELCDLVRLEVADGKHTQEFIRGIAALRAAGVEGKPVAAPEECGACHGSGWVPRDADIGTEQECFLCGGSGKAEAE